MTRALVVAPRSTPGGSQRILCGLVRHLPAHGVDVRATLFQHGPLERWLVASGCPTEVLDAGDTRRAWRLGPTLLHLAGRARDADVVLSNQAKGHAYGGLAAARAGVPAVWWQHERPTRRRTELVAARVPSRAIVCCTPEIAAAQRRLAPQRNVVVVAGGIAVDEIQERAGSGAAVRARHGWDQNRVVGIVGRFVAWKRHDVFLRAAALVATRLPDVRFVLVGGPGGPRGSARAHSMTRLADELGIRDRTLFTGRQDDPYPWFDACDVVVHASDEEPFGLVVLEGMALGKPVVATATGGPLAIVEHGRSGVLVPPGEPVAMAHAIEDILRDPGLAARLGDGARRRVRDFDEEQMAERFAGVLREATEAHGAKVTRW